ncbi:MAG: SDR family oxidoreductase [Kangiellaceae bacterium]|nr:SDR family oxidoreductase [Kangiellaceae bacterium]
MFTKGFIMKLSNRYPSLKNKTVFISGGGSGIGAHLVESFARQGAKIAFVDILKDESIALVKRLELAIPNSIIRYFECDLFNIDLLQKIIAEVALQLGSISVLVNNAASDTRHNIKNITPDYWDDRMNINLKHYFFAIQAVQQQMISMGNGSIINMGSMCWHECQSGMPGYSAAKAGVVGLTRGLAKDLGQHKIRINTITPGWVMTDRQLSHWVNENTEKKIAENQCLKDYVMPEDIAAMALFLASDDSRHCTAQDFIVDGGWI